MGIPEANRSPKPTPTLVISTEGEAAVERPASSLAVVVAPDRPVFTPQQTKRPPAKEAFVFWTLNPGP
jgi:hypothetical protein